MVISGGGGCVNKNVHSNIFSPNETGVAEKERLNPTVGEAALKRLFRSAAAHIYTKAEKSSQNATATVAALPFFIYTDAHRRGRMRLNFGEQK